MVKVYEELAFYINPGNVITTMKTEIFFKTKKKNKKKKKKERNRTTLNQIWNFKRGS